jgi:hypothetical protein
MLNLVSNFSKFPEFRIVRTGLFGGTYYDILRSVMGQLSDGIWENSAIMKKFWKNAHVAWDDGNGEIVILVNKRRSEIISVPYYWSIKNNCMEYKNTIMVNPFVEMDDAKVCSWFADKIRSIVHTEMRDAGGKFWWSKKPEVKLEYIGYKSDVTVGDCRDVFNALKAI